MEDRIVMCRRMIHQPASVWFLSAGVLLLLLSLLFVACSKSSRSSELLQEARAQNEADVSAKFVQDLWPVYWEQIEQIKNSPELVLHEMDRAVVSFPANLGLYDVAFENYRQFFDLFPKLEGSLNSLPDVLRRAADPRLREYYRKTFNIFEFDRTDKRGGIGDADEYIHLFLAKQIEVGYVKDAYEQASTIEIPEVRCWALFMLADALKHQGYEKLGQQALQEVNSLLPELNEGELKSYLKKALEAHKTLSQPFSPALLENVTQSWREGQEPITKTMEKLMEFIYRLRLRRDHEGAGATIRFIEDHMLDDLLLVGPNSNKGNYEFNTWFRLLDACIEFKQFDTLIRLLDAGKPNSKPGTKLVSNYARKSKLNILRCKTLSTDRKRELLLKLLQLCQDASKQTPIQLGQWDCHIVVLELQLLFGTDDDINLALKPFTDAVDSNDALGRKGVRFTLARNLAKGGALQSILRLCDRKRKDEAFRGYSLSQMIYVLLNEGRLDEALEKFHSMSRHHRATAIGYIAAYYYQHEGKERALQFFRDEVAKFNDQSNRLQTGESGIQHQLKSIRSTSNALSAGAEFLDAKSNWR